MASAPTIVKSAWKIIPQFQSRDIDATVAFYETELGFTTSTHAADGGKNTFCSVFAGQKADANLYYMLLPEEDELKTSSAMIALGTKQLDEYYEHLKTHERVTITAAIEDKSWGYRQFSFQDPDGNTLTFFKFLEGGNPGDE